MEFPAGKKLTNLSMWKNHRDISAILLESWDPKGINDVAPHDEYAPYAADLYLALIAGHTELGLIDLLTSLEENRIGHSAPLDRKVTTARRLLTLNLSLRPVRQG